MRRWSHWRLLPLFLVMGLLATLVQAQSTDPAPPTPTLNPVMAPSPDPTATEPTAIALTIWWVDTLAPVQGESGNLRASQLRAITDSLPGVEVRVRLKPANGPGSLREALLAADAVAPGALPDLALVARQDLPYLIDSGLAQPIDDAVSEADLERFYPAAVVLGDVNGRLFGLPYALELQHLVYRPPEVDLATFADSLEAGRSLLLPLGGDDLSPVVLAQYLSCGGVLQDGPLTTLEEAPLRCLLNYYSQATGLALDPRSILYSHLGETLPVLTSTELNAGLVNTAGYFSLLAVQPDWRFSSAPLATEPPITVVNGWLWVVLTADAIRQEAALAIINQLLGDDRLATYTSMVGALPATPTALALWPDDTYGAFAGGLLATALPLPDETRELTGMRLMNAIRQVVNGVSVEEALTAALNAD